MAKAEKKNRLVFMLCAAGILILLTIAFASYGWFMNNRTASGDMNSFQSTDSDFELASADSSGVFDEYLTFGDGNILSGVNVGGLLNRKDLVSTGNGKNEIKWLMSSESNFGNYSGADADTGIQPGSSGMLSFYVIAKRDTDLDIRFSLETVLYTSEAKPIDESNADNSDCIIDKDSAETKLFDGHILFFRSYDKSTGLYSDLMTDGTFEFSEKNAEAGKGYRTDIYWVWPYMADQLIMPEGDGCFDGKKYSKLISDDDTAKLLAEMKKFPEKYFDDTAFGVSDMLDNISKGTGDAGFSADSYNTVNNHWNGADQIIGKEVGFAELQVSNADVE